MQIEDSIVWWKQNWQVRASTVTTCAGFLKDLFECIFRNRIISSSIYRSALALLEHLVLVNTKMASEERASRAATCASFIKIWNVQAYNIWALQQWNYFVLDLPFSPLPTRTFRTNLYFWSSDLAWVMRCVMRCSSCPWNLAAGGSKGPSCPTLVLANAPSSFTFCSSKASTRRPIASIVFLAIIQTMRV